MHNMSNLTCPHEPDEHFVATFLAIGHLGADSWRPGMCTGTDAWLLREAVAADSVHED